MAKRRQFLAKRHSFTESQLFLKRFTHFCFHLCFFLFFFFIEVTSSSGHDSSNVLAEDFKNGHDHATATGVSDGTHGGRKSDQNTAQAAFHTTPGGKRMGKEDKGRGEREIGSEALAEKKKKSLTPQQGIEPGTPANAAGTFAIFSFLPNLHFQFAFLLSLPRSFPFLFPSTVCLRLPSPSAGLHSKIQFNIYIFFIIPGMFSLRVWVVASAHSTRKVSSFLLCFVVGVAVFLTEQSRCVDSNDLGGTMGTDEAPVNRSAVDRGASATGGAEDSQAISMSRLKCSALCSESGAETMLRKVLC